MNDKCRNHIVSFEDYITLHVKQTVLAAMATKTTPTSNVLSIIQAERRQKQPNSGYGDYHSKFKHTPKSSVVFKLHNFILIKWVNVIVFLCVCLTGYCCTKESCYSVQKERMDTGQGTNTASGGKITIEFINKDVTGDTGRIRTDSMTQ